MSRNPRRGNERWTIFISGRGSNLQTLLDGIEENRIVLVVSSSPKAAGVLKARRAGIPVFILDKKIDWLDLQKQLELRSVSRIFLAGFMRLVPAPFLENWKDAILNVHPSLLPDFPGLEAIEKSFHSGGEMGVTVHVVTPEMDGGPHLLKKRAVTAGNSRSSLTLSRGEFLISVTEQSLVREAFRRWN